MWLLPGRHGDLSLLARAQFAGAITPLEGFLPILRGLRYQAALARARELDPFLYLFAIGVRPNAQGLGAGSRLLSAGLEVARAVDLGGELVQFSLKDPGSDLSDQSLPGFEVEI